MQIPLSHIEVGLVLEIKGEEFSQKIISEDDSLEFGEAIYQLTEGCNYEYQFNKPNFKFRKSERNRIISISKFDSNKGSILPNIYVGTHNLEICDQNENILALLPLEVCSAKSEYRSDYRFMLESITKKCIDLIMQIDSPVSQHFETNFETDSRTLYQKFSFVKSLIDSREFEEAVHMIITCPATKWQTEEELRDIRSIRRFNKSSVMQLVNAGNRVKIPESHNLYKNYAIKTAPERIESIQKTESLDTSENRFIKHALEEFMLFCEKCEGNFDKYSGARTEANTLANKLSNLLNQPFFRDISRPETLKLNSPVLQRKSGYREVLDAWLRFDLAARLTWQGGDNVYDAGKKNIAVLYEYWLFFTLLDIMKEVFSIEPKSLEELITIEKGGLSLNLKQGKSTALYGVFHSDARKLRIQFTYNRSFGGGRKYPSGGSYTTTLRPDYTLSIWPEEIKTQNVAELKELITHIHFDAKYKVNNFFSLISKSKEEELSEEENSELTREEEEEEKKGTYKNQDLLKMHAYKDAIRRSGGAYILYPGEGKDDPFRGFHELIPGLGAFVIKPDENNSGKEELVKFIKKVTSNFIDRASQREYTAVKVYDIHKTVKGDENTLNEPFPEYLDSLKTVKLIPDETFVLVGYCIDDKRHEWYLEKGLYNFRMDDEEGSLILDNEVVNAKYLLLRRSSKDTASEIFKILSKGPKVYSKEAIKSKGYPDPKHENYLVIEIEKHLSEDLGDSFWDFKQLIQYQKLKDKIRDPYKLAGIPFTASITELMKTKIKINNQK